MLGSFNEAGRNSEVKNARWLGAFLSRFLTAGTGGGNYDHRHEERRQCKTSFAASWRAWKRWAIACISRQVKSAPSSA